MDGVDFPGFEQQQQQQQQRFIDDFGREEEEFYQERNSRHRMVGKNHLGRGKVTGFSSGIIETHVSPEESKQPRLDR